MIFIQTPSSVGLPVRIIVSRSFNIGVAFLAFFALAKISFGGMFATGAFTNNIYLFDTVTGTQSVYNSVSTNPGFSGLASIAVNQSNGRVYVSSFSEGRVFTFDGYTANQAVSELVLGTATNPTGITIDESTGNVYIATKNGANNQVSVFNSSNTLINTYTGAGIGNAGLLFTPNGLLTANGAEGIVVPNISSINLSNGVISTFTNTNGAPFVNGLASDSAGNIYAGSVTDFTGQVGSNGVYKFDGTTGTNTQAGNAPLLSVTGGATIPAAFNSVGGPPSSPFTSPSAVAFDRDGNLIVGVLGQTNPFVDFTSNGAILRYDTSGNLLNTVVSGFTPINALALQPISAVPEPSTIVLLSVLSVTIVARRRLVRDKQR